VGKLTVKRKGYKRKAYKRKGGVRVKASKVKGSSFSVRDRGKPGRTPKSQRFFHPKRHTGWRKTQSVTTRRRLMLKAHGGDYLAAARALIALHNVTTDAETKRLAYADADFFFRKHNKQSRR
jgi:hypothetical protein